MDQPAGDFIRLRKAIQGLVTAEKACAVGTPAGFAADNDVVMGWRRAVDEELGLLEGQFSQLRRPAEVQHGG